MNSDLVPGKVTLEHFNLLLEGTAITGKQVTEALRLHLVENEPSKTVIVTLGKNRSQFYARLTRLKKESVRASLLAPFYLPKRSRKPPAVNGLGFAACPFCGGFSLGFSSNGVENHFVSCDDCGVDGPPSDTTEEALKKWNARTEAKHHGRQ